ncbi:dTDP-4-dehydrorhamnose reductase [Fundidesulfovibrio magnetotacticus]|uniref:dTDP-4-dehydrorhamnose reductase n=1 Tax=Fundidesulfovibrio magnetotacticus TaxID=2730080 RepID=A0A6V8LN89_9BACT|nr:dTDP-4-dehydrorhamnose reductase [Fundidesulfovibrio magnetotacticus]GFK93134.1 dTDP-4-dehydrorhamnose reductase [Fundidesulfovibrio magnetotacticus]
MTPGRIAVLGGRTGLLGVPLARALEARGYEVEPLGRADFDPLSSEAAARFLDDYQPHWLVNAVAYTAVDKAEDEPAEAATLNKALPAMLGRLCQARSIGLFHFSTDFVFDGKKNTPYTEEDPTGPASVYGQTKLDGEKALTALGMQRLIIARVAWLFGPGKKNFVRTILNLAKEREELGVVHDQIGSPSYTPDLAEYAASLLQADANGLFHLANAGRASWCELAGEAVAAAGLTCRVRPITTADYPLKAARPAYSVLDTAKFTRATGVAPRPWLQALREYVYTELEADPH